MNLFKDIKEMGLQVDSSNAKVRFKVFEYNLWALDIVIIPIFRPRNKNLNCILHHFSSYLDDTKEIFIHNIGILNQPADFLPNPLNYASFFKFFKMVMGW